MEKDLKKNEKRKKEWFNLSSDWHFDCIDQYD